MEYAKGISLITENIHVEMSMVVLSDAVW